MKRSLAKWIALGAAAACSLTLAACGGGGQSSSDQSGSSGKQTLTLAGWSLDSTPEFKTLADAFHKANPDITVKIKEYSADNYDTQLTADLSAGSAPDLFPMKNNLRYYYYASNGQLLDVSDVAKKYDGDKNIDLSQLKLDGKFYALPYRQDSWVLFYNKALFKKAGVADPDGSWTWDDFVKTAQQLTTKLKGQGAKGTYIHNWQSLVQGFALAQYPGATLDSGDLSYLKPYYQWNKELQDSGATVDFSTSQAQSLQYQAEFGTQKAAILPMGTWYIATLLQQRKTGDADTFDWGLAPAPQYDSSTVGKNVTFGDPTSWAANASLKGDKATAAKKFLEFASGEQGAIALAKIGITPAYFSDKVQQTIFSLDGMPQDALSKTAFSVHDTKAENPVGEHTNDIQTILKDTDSSIRTGAKSIDQGISDAQNQIKNEGLTQQ